MMNDMALSGSMTKEECGQGERCAVKQSTGEASAPDIAQSRPIGAALRISFLGERRFPSLLPLWQIIRGV